MLGGRFNFTLLYLALDLLYGSEVYSPASAAAGVYKSWKSSATSLNIPASENVPQIQHVTQSLKCMKVPMVREKQAASYTEHYSKYL